MINPELLILLINAVVIFIAYKFVFPKVAGSDIKKIATNDMMSSMVALSITASIFWGSNQAFDLIISTVNWFWFTLITYFILETPAIFWYFKKYNIRIKME